MTTGRINQGASFVFTFRRASRRVSGSRSASSRRVRQAGKVLRESVSGHASKGLAPLVAALRSPRSVPALIQRAREVTTAGE